MKKKIIFVTKALWIGGIETALVNLLNYFDYEKYDVTLLALHAELDMLDQIHPSCRVLIADREKTYTFEENYKYSRLYHMTEETDSPSKLHKMMMWTVPPIKWMENRLYIRYIRKLMSEEFFDICIIYSDAAAETAIRAINADKYLMFYHHGAMRHVYHDEIAYKKCDKIIAVSDNQANELKKFVSSAANKIISIHNLTDVETIRAKAAQSTVETFDNAKFNIVSVGRVSREKGMDIAIHVCAKLVKEGFEHVRWWIVGNGPAMQEIRNAIAETNMEDYIILVGMKENPYPYIKNADLYVQPSRFEGYPMTILEALVLGQPVVSTNNNGPNQILEDGVTGLLRPIDSDLIADAVKPLIENKDILDRMKHSVNQLDFEKQNKQYILQLEELL
ncbi:MAG: glycosyltransferase [Clostridia bacterium]|nr:glycosyltransferase [Clostridia bacterium]